MGEPRRAGSGLVRAGGAVAAHAQHRVRRRGTVPVRRPYGDRALAARRRPPGQLSNVFLRCPRALSGARRCRRQRRRAGGRPSRQPPRDADHHRVALLADPQALQRAGRPVRCRHLLRDRVGTVPRPSGHL